MTMLKHVPGYRFSLRAQFGSYKSQAGKDLVNRPKRFVKSFSVWAAPYAMDSALKYKNMGTELSDMIQIAIRPTSKVTKDMHCVIQGGDNEYKITDIQKHTTNKPIGYDLITLEVEN